MFQINFKQSSKISETFQIKFSWNEPNGWKIKAILPFLIVKCWNINEVIMEIKLVNVEVECSYNTNIQIFLN